MFLPEILIILQKLSVTLLKQMFYTPDLFLGSVTLFFNNFLISTLIDTEHTGVLPNMQDGASCDNVMAESH